MLSPGERVPPAMQERGTERRFITEGGTADLTVFAWVYDDGPGDTSESYVVARGAGPSAALQAWSLSLVDLSGARRPRKRA